MDLLAFTVTSLLIELTPGPNMGTLAVIAATNGRMAGLSMVAGIALGLSAIALGAALGLAEIIAASSLLFEVLRWGGGLFLLYLAYQAWSAADEPVNKTLLDAGKARGFFMAGLITNILNPKAALFYVAVLPRFLGSGDNPLGPFILSAIYVAVATVIHVAIALFASTLSKLLVNNERQARQIRKAMALLLALIAISLIITTRQD